MRRREGGPGGCKVGQVGWALGLALLAMLDLAL